MPWATFDKVIKLYVFDRELRNIILDAIERIEVALRCRIVYEYCHRHGNNWYENSSLFLKNHGEFLKMIYFELGKSKELFISHYYSKYTIPKHPPAWMAVEVMSFGQLSKMFSNLKTNDAKKAVASHFGLSQSILESWIEHLVYIRNICAHHSRLWNRTMTITATIPNNTSNQWITINPTRSDKLYTTVCIINYLLITVAKNSPYAGKLKTILHRFSNLNKNAAGFPKNWERDIFWENTKIGFTHKIRIIFFKAKSILYKKMHLS